MRPTAMSCLQANPCLMQPEHRNFFFFRRLLNKTMKRRSDNIEKQYDQAQYLAAMKKFQKLTKGMLPNSPEWTNIRN